MANVVPGALWKPVDVGNRAARRKGRGLIGHIAVVNSTLLIPGPLATRPSDWHFYLPKQPYPTGQRFAQLIDLDLQSWSSADANPTCAAFESEGGVGADVNGLWTDNQIESAAIILAHMHRTEGVPLQDMVNSLPGSRGFGVHRYGIDPYRVAGGEKWSSVYAKACPGDARVRQVPQIIARAQQIVNGNSGGFLMALTDAQQAQLAADAQFIADQMAGPDWRKGTAGWPTQRWGGDQEQLTVVDLLRRIDRQLNSVLDLSNRPMPAGTGDNEFGHLLSLRAEVQALLAAAGKAAPTSGGSVAAGSLSDADVARIADALAAKLAGRLES
jgi:hypothetical protein